MAIALAWQRWRATWRDAWTPARRLALTTALALGIVGYAQGRGAAWLLGAAPLVTLPTRAAPMPPCSANVVLRETAVVAPRLPPPPAPAPAPAVHFEERRVSPEPVLAPPVVSPEAPNPLSLLRVRVVPEQLNGRVIGLRLFGIREGSLLKSIGLQNGDRLESINGFNVATPEQALEAYARLRIAQRLILQLNRRGAPVELRLNIN